MRVVRPDEQRLASVERGITAAGGDACSLSLDLRAPDAPSQLVDFAIARYGRIDIVVNNAGATKRGDLLELSDADFADGFALKDFATVRLVRAAWPWLRAAAGSVVNIAGVGGRTPGAFFAIGGSVNAAILSLTKSLAAAGLDAGIQVNAINPGPIRTERLQKRLAALAGDRHIPREAAERLFIETEQVTRIGEPEASQSDRVPGEPSRPVPARRLVDAVTAQQKLSKCAFHNRVACHCPRRQE